MLGKLSGWSAGLRSRRPGVQVPLRAPLLPQRARRSTCAGGCRPVGESTDGIVIVKGVYPLVDTHGIPLEVVLDYLKSHGMMPDWLDYYEASVEAGTKPERAIVRLSTAVGDVYGPTFRVEWESRLREVIARR